VAPCAGAWPGRPDCEWSYQDRPSTAEKSRTSRWHSDPMANFGISRRRQQNLRSERQYSLPYRAGKGAPCVALLFAGRLLVLLRKYYVRRGCKRNIDEYLEYARSKWVYFMLRYVTIAYILMIEETHHAFVWLIKDRITIRVEYGFAGRFWSFTKICRTSFIETRRRFPVREVDPQLSVRQRFTPRVRERPGILVVLRAHARIARACRVQKFLGL
jgi:hypothetical protein